MFTINLNPAAAPVKKSACLILKQQPVALPYQESVYFPTRSSDFELTINGEVSANPFQFAVDIKEDERILLHVNPRWSENRIVMNSYSMITGWGQEEYDWLTLKPNQVFSLTISSKAGYFEICFNHGRKVLYKQRMTHETREKKIALTKVNGDIRVSLIKLDVFKD